MKPTTYLLLPVLGLAVFGENALRADPMLAPRPDRVIFFDTRTRNPKVAGVVPLVAPPAGQIPTFYRRLSFSGERHSATAPLQIQGTTSQVVEQKREKASGAIQYAYNATTDQIDISNGGVLESGAVSSPAPWSYEEQNWPSPPVLTVTPSLTESMAIPYNLLFVAANNPLGLPVKTATTAGDDNQFSSGVGGYTAIAASEQQFDWQMELSDEEESTSAIENRAKVTTVSNQTDVNQRSSIRETRQGSATSWMIREVTVRYQLRIACPGDYIVTKTFRERALTPNAPWDRTWSVPEVVHVTSSVPTFRTFDIPLTDDKEVQLVDIGVQYPAGCAGNVCSMNGGIAGGLAGPVNGSIYWYVPLGTAHDGRSAGGLILHRENIDAAAYSPGSLSVATTDGAITIRDAQDRPRQILVPQALADIVPTAAQAYEMRFYERSQAGTPGTDGLYAPTGSPYLTWRIENPDTSGATTNRLRVTRIIGAENVVTEIDESQAAKRVFSEAGGLRVTETTTSAGWTGTRVETVIVKNAADEVATKRQLHYQQFAWGDERVKEVLDPDGAALTTEWTYGTNANDPSYRQVIKIKRPDGFEETTGFANNGLDTTRILPVWTSQSQGIGRSVQSTDLDADGLPDQLTTIETTMFLSLLRREWTVDWGTAPTATYRVRDHYLATEGSAAWNSSSNLRTRERFAIGSDELIYRLAPDGTLLVRSASTNGSGQTTTVEDAGAPDAGGETVVDGTRTTTVHSAKGQLTSTVVIDIASGRTLQSVIATETDEHGRPTRLVHLDGAEEVRDYCSTCGQMTDVTLRGETTHFEFDALGRKTAEIHSAGSTVLAHTSFGYDADGRLLRRIRHDLQSGAETVLASTTYDLAGRVAAETTSAQGTTGYTYALGAGNQTVVTTTYADGGTRIETRGASGALVSLRGTAAAPVDYAYATRTWDGRGDGYLYSIKKVNDDGSFNTEEQSIDLRGEIEYSRFAGDAYLRRYYDGAGRLAREVDPDGVTTLHGYDARGRPSVVAVDINRNGTIDYAGTDRITRTLYEVGVRDGATVARTTTQVWETDNVDAPTVASIEETGADALRSWLTARGLTTSRVTTFDGAGGRVVATTGPDGTINEQTFLGDRLLAVVTRHASLGTLRSVTREFDSAGRLWKTTDARNGTTTFTYSAQDRLLSVVTPDPDATRAGAGYDPQTTTYGYDAMGRVTSVTQPDGGVVNTTYYPTGAVKRTWGARTCPVEHAYDGQGRLKTMTTWQDFTGDTGRAVTSWTYDNDRGWLLNKRYADGTGPSYAYWPSGRLRTRTWARTPAITTTYGYDNAGGLSSVDYSDGTPDVTTSYDRLGRPKVIADGAGSRTLAYHASGQLEDESYTAGMLNGLSVDRSFDALHRLSGVSALSSQPSTLSSATYAYDAASRLDTVTAGQNTATYGYLANSGLVETLTFKNAGATRLTTTKAYDQLNRLTSISNLPSSISQPLSYAYDYNSANQRTRATREDNGYWSYDYDALGHVTSGSKFLADGTAALGLSHAWNFDDIGNRKTTTVNGQTSSYTPTALNQYSQRTVPGVIDVLGAAVTDAPVAVSVGPDTALAQRQSETFFRQVPIDNTVAARPTSVHVAALQTSSGTPVAATQTRAAFVAKTPEVYSHDADGNLTGDGRWIYTWDGENRLVAIETNAAAVTAGAPKQRLEFAYDGQSRRVSKKVFAWTGSAWSLSSHTLFVYDGWNLLVEAGTSGLLVRAYAWGLDLSGSLQGAGGVGGLLGITDAATGTTHFAAFDGNGNVSGMASAADGTLTARYDYNAFGETVLSEGSAAAANPFRFSTKFSEVETGFLYYGYRYYAPQTGRWLSRDPMGEQGGVNLYAFLGNRPIDEVDPLGLATYCSGRVRTVTGGGYERRTKRPKPGYTPSLSPSATDVCGSSGFNVPDEFVYNDPGSWRAAPAKRRSVRVNFSPACAKHDICYGTCGTDRKTCDQNMQRDMKAICATLPPYARGRCEQTADIYYAGLRLGGGLAFESAQDGACEWEPCCISPKRFGP